MPSPCKRRYPRILTDTQVELIVGKRRVRGIARSASMGGVSIELCPSQEPLTRGSTVRLGIDVEGSRKEFPGRVVWHRNAATGVGIQIQLEIAGQAYRAAYGRWLNRLANRR